MKYQVELLSILKYEKDGRKGTRLGYRMLDKEMLQNSDKFKGFSELSIFFDNHEVFNKIPVNLFGTAVTMVINEVPSTSNPFKKKIIAEQINDISLV